MRYIFTILAALLFVVGCEQEQEFSCTIAEVCVDWVGHTEATLSAKVIASNYDDIDRVAFLVRKAGGENESYVVSSKRIVERKIEGLEPDTQYEFSVVVYAVGDSWHSEAVSFRTLKPEEKPEPEPEPEPEP